METDLVSQRQMAKMIAVPEPTLRRAVKLGRIEADLRSGNEVLFLPSRAEEIRKILHRPATKVL